MRFLARSVGLLTCAASLCVGSPSHSAQAGGGRALRFGVMAEEPTEPDRLLSVYGPFVRVLRERLAADRIDVPGIVVARDLEDLAQRLTRGEVDFVIESLSPNLTLQGQAPTLRPALLVVRRGQRRYRSVFFTRPQSSVKSLADLRGRTLVLQDEHSTSAFALPQLELRRAGLVSVAASEPAAPAGAVTYVLAGAEINQAFWVIQGRAEAGAFSNADWTALPEKVRSQLLVFHETKAVPRGLVSFRGNLAPEIRAKAERTLLTLHEDEAGRSALAAAVGTTRFERLTPEDIAELDAWAPILRSLAPKR
jgi:phosphonate transport system substrate-binding protein